MTVQMRTTFNIGASQKDYRYELHIFFDAKVKQRDDTNDKDVFPGTALDITISASQAGNRQYKLHDEGMTVEVRKARRSKNGGTSWQKFKRKIEDAILRTHDDNCVDMMFVSSPPEVLGTLAPPLYCLGRCENPPVVNTGL